MVRQEEKRILKKLSAINVAMLKAIHEGLIGKSERLRYIKQDIKKYGIR